MEYLSVSNWEKYQHYSHRNPPWIKLHVRILNNRNFSLLSRASKCLLMLLWILASEEDGTIPYDMEEIKFRLRDNTIKESEIKQLISKGFLHSSNQVQADASKEYPETETETEKRQSKKFVPPLIEDVIKYFQENGYSEESAKNAFHYYQDGDWKDSRGQPVRSWKQKMRGVWFKPENKKDQGKGRLQPKEFQTPNYLQKVTETIGKKVNEEN